MLPRRWLPFVAAFVAAIAAGRAADLPAVHGLPFIRSYSLGDIGTVPRGSRLGFDRFGRVAVIHDAVYSVLNDNVWLNLAEPGGMDRIPMTNVVQAPDGRTYYGARASWGRAEFGPDGKLHPVPLVSADPPRWVHTAVFDDLISTRDGIYFVSWNGVVYWDFARQRSFLFEMPGLSRAFPVGDRLYISSFGEPLRYIDARTTILRLAPPSPLDSRVVEYAAPLDDSRCLVSFGDSQMDVFDGRRLTPWLPRDANVITGHVSVLQRLADGKIAVGVTGQGLLLFSPGGQLLLALTMARYQNITALANREPGVLWVGTEETIDKVMYGSPLSAFGPMLGLPIGWPIVVRWRGQLYVGSGGKLYEALAGRPGEPTRFELCAHQPPRGTFALDAWGTNMLVGNGSGLFEAEPDGTYRAVPAVRDLVYIVMTDATHCFEIGRSEIAALERREGRWTESMPRIHGVQNPAIVHRVGRSVWIEMGGDGVARLSIRDGRLRLDVVSNESWTKASWVNIGTVGDIVVLSSMQEEPRRFFSEKTGDWCDAPDLERLLDRSPFWIARVEQDDHGVIWATHNEGLVRFEPHGGGYDMDVGSFDLVNDRYPVVRILPDGDVWMSAARSLYHVERNWHAAPAPTPRPTLVSIVDAARNVELYAASRPAPKALRLPYASNNLTFRFFSGTDTWRRPPVYEYRLSRNESWTAFDGSTLGFRGLREGVYQLQVRLATDRNAAEPGSLLKFEIVPPWHRSWPAYVLFGAMGAVLLFGVVRWSNYLERRRNRLLEKVVQERTRQLEATMVRLGEETRNAATLAERDRMASEIHDSVQQGLTGAMLQLDSTLKLPTVTGSLRARLDVVRNMVSYARQEVEHAVWDMESPLLDGAELGDALRNLTAFMHSGTVTVEVAVIGAERRLGREINHHLLRIAQEATTNAFRHAQAGHIAIRLNFEETTVTLEIDDDGVGFSASEVLQGRAGHLGLRGIQTRVRKLGGQLAIESEPGRGTLIRITVPVHVDPDLVHHADSTHHA